MKRWNSSVDDLKSTLCCSFQNGYLVTRFISDIEIAESQCRFPRSSILRLCKTYRRKLTAAIERASRI